jgi:hypothetical protein
LALLTTSDDDSSEFYFSLVVVVCATFVVVLLSFKLVFLFVDNDELLVFWLVGFLLSLPFSSESMEEELGSDCF